MFLRKILKVILIFIAVVGFLYGQAWLLSLKKNEQAVFGVSFSPDYARYLQLDPKKVFDKIAGEWGFKYIRLSVQWNNVEKEKGKFDFSETDYFINEAEKNGMKVVLAIGQKTPRWPECHIPAWAEELQNDEYKQSLNNYISETVKRYKDNLVLEMWQVENEPFLPFGDCKIYKYADLKAEVELVKSLDETHSLITTDSGELSTWQRSARATEFFGTTMYRVAWNKQIGYFDYDWVPPFFYVAKLWLAGKSTAHAFVMELQAEPWIADQNLIFTSLDEQYKSMDINRLQKNIVYAQKVGFPRVYLWGAEWWYWMNEEKGVDDFVEEIKKLKKE
ncbi:MAG: endo-1,4-beta-xylanase [Candidatus Magasanikbacteria bacterium]|nr:endo-1,4-beta-xylanase [Candidatus Magasanikbacteria bacterium]